LLSHIKDEHGKTFHDFIRKDLKKFLPFIEIYDGRVLNSYEHKIIYPTKPVQQVQSEFSAHIKENQTLQSRDQKNLSQRIYQSYQRAWRLGKASKGDFTGYIHCPSCFIPISVRKGALQGFNAHIVSCHSTFLWTLINVNFPLLKDFFQPYNGEQLTVEEHLKKYKEIPSDDVIHSIKEFLKVMSQNISLLPITPLKNDSSDVVEGTINTEEITPEISEEITPEISEEITPEISEEITPEISEEITPEIPKSLEEDFHEEILNDQESFPIKSLDPEEIKTVVGLCIDRSNLYTQQLDSLQDTLINLDTELVEVQNRLEMLNKSKYTLIAEKELLLNILQLYRKD
jgi:hypothetical protein